MMKLMSEVSYGRVVRNALLAVPDWHELSRDRLQLMQHFPGESIPAAVLAPYLSSVALTANMVCLYADRQLLGSMDRRLDPALAVHGIAAVLRVEAVHRINRAERLFGQMTNAKRGERGEYLGGPFALLRGPATLDVRYPEEYGHAILPDLYDDVNLQVHGDGGVRLIKQEDFTVQRIVDLAAPRQITAEFEAFHRALEGV